MSGGAAPQVTEQSRTRYARSGTVSIAYQVVGDGPRDLVYVARAVMDAAGSERAAILGQSEAGGMAMRFAASYVA